MKIWALVVEIFAKQYWWFLIIDFQCIFDISTIMHLQSLPRWIITEWLWDFFETKSQNGPISVKWKHQSQLTFCILRLSHRHIDFDSSQGTPCSNKITFQSFEFRGNSPHFYFFGSMILNSLQFLCLGRTLLQSQKPCRKTTKSWHICTVRSL